MNFPSFQDGLIQMANGDQGWQYMSSSSLLEDTQKNLLGDQSQCLGCPMGDYDILREESNQSEIDCCAFVS